MKNRRNARRLVALMLVILLLPLKALPEEDAPASFAWLQGTYETGRASFQMDDLSSIGSARSVFEETGNYRDSRKYVHYIDASNALEAEDYESAATLFQALGNIGLLDAARQYQYTQARRAEMAGAIKSAMILYARADVRDASARYAALQSAHPEIDTDEKDPPEGAREGGYAYVMKDGAEAVSWPGGSEALLDFALLDAVEMLSFEHDAQGRAWVEIAVTPENEETMTGYLPASALHFMTEAEQSDYLQALQNAVPPPTDHYGRVTTGGVHIRPEASKKSGSSGEVKRKEIVEILGMETGDDNEQWFRILAGDGISGYLQARYIEELTEEEDWEHRVMLGIGTPPAPDPTPIPVPAPTELPTPRDVPAIAERPYAPFEGEMTDDEKYDRALFLLTDGREEALEEAITLFEAIDGHRNEAVYVPFARLLLLVEKGDFESAKKQLDQMFREWYFDGTLAQRALEIKIPGSGTIYQYIRAREAEQNGETHLAVALLDGLDFRDSASRMIRQYMKLEAPSVRDAVDGVRPGGAVEKPIQEVYLTSAELRSLKTLYRTMSEGDSLGAVEMLANGEYTDLFHAALHGQTYLFDGEALHQNIEGTGLALRGPQLAFYGDFAGGRPDGQCAAAGMDSNGGAVFVEGSWKKGELSGEARISYYLDGEAQYVIFEGTYGPNDAANGEVIRYSKMNSQTKDINTFAFNASDGCIVLDDQWTMRGEADAQEMVLLASNNPGRFWKYSGDRFLINPSPWGRR